MKKISIKDEQLYIDNEVVNINDLIFDYEISRGANGIAYKVKDPYLERELVLKIWVKFRRKDKRDKFKQGIYEARKNWDASSNIKVAQVYYSGVIKDLFFTVMEFISGPTLKSYLYPLENDWLSIGGRFNVAEQLLELNNSLVKKDIIHGDLHCNNIIPIITRYKQGINRRFEINIKIIDFGTSYFTNKVFSIERNYEVIIETVSKCLKPFQYLKLLNMETKPLLEESDKMLSWLILPIFYIRAAYFELGYEFVGWPFKVDPYVGYKASNRVKIEEYKNAVSSVIEGNPKYAMKRFVGTSIDWSDFDGRLK